MADIKITALNELLYAGMAAGDVFVIDDINASESKKITTASVKQYCTENRGIGTNVAGAFVLTDSSQTLSNKRIDNLQLNEAVACTATSTELNKLHSCTTSTAELNKLTGVTTTATQFNYLNTATGNIQTQINALSSLIESATTKTYTYQYGFTLGAGVTTLDRTQAQILGDMSISPTGYIIDHRYITAQLWQVQNGTYTNVVLESGGANVVFTKQNVAGQDQLDTLSLSGMTAEKEYNLVLTFKISDRQGV